MQVFMKTSVPRHVPVSLYMAFYFACLQKHPNDTKALARYLSTESINAIQTYPNTFLTAICPSIKFSHSRRRSWYVCVGGSFTILRARGRHGRALLSYIFFYSLSYFLKLQSIFFFFFDIRGWLLIALTLWLVCWQTLRAYAYVLHSL